MKVTYNPQRHLIFPTPLGDAAILYQDHPFLMKEILLPRANGEELAATAEKWGKSGFHPNADLVAEDICEYFEGKIIGVPWEWMEMGKFTELTKKVLMSVAHIPYGQVRSYKDIACDIGHPKASRFVGTSVARNPFPLLIPCHRVIRSDGSIGQFGGGTDMKQKLIEMERTFLRESAFGSRPKDHAAE